MDTFSRHCNMANFHYSDPQHRCQQPAQGQLHQVLGHLVPCMHHFHLCLALGIRFRQLHFQNSVSRLRE